MDPFGPEDDLPWDEDEPETGDPAPLVRPAWWRWVAIAVILALVVAGPFAVVLFKLLS
jgi:hypothetical protein